MFVFNNNLTLSNCEKLCSSISFIHFDNYKFLLKNDVKQAQKLYMIFMIMVSVIDILDFIYYTNEILEKY